MSGLFSTFKIAASALTAQRLRMDVISSNIANAETTRTEGGGPYQRQQVVFSVIQPDTGFVTPASMPTAATEPDQGVKVQAIIKDDSPGQRVYDPGHPDADEDGFVEYPNVNIATEMTDMLSATRSYEANVTVFNALKSMAAKALEIGAG